jgi:hypothetical protein
MFLVGPKVFSFVVKIIIIRNGAKTRSLQMLFGGLNSFPITLETSVL